MTTGMEGALIMRCANGRTDGMTSGMWEISNSKASRMIPRELAWAITLDDNASMYNREGKRNTSSEGKDDDTSSYGYL